MTKIARASLCASLAAPAEAVYALISDYRDGDPRILPHRHFPSLEVERGGVGAGTIIRFEFRLPGVTRRIRAEISEPKPGEEIVERDLETGARTVFTVHRAGLRASKVTISTEGTPVGLRGWIESKLVPPLLRRIDAEQLDRIRTATATRSSEAPDGRS